jgi:gamma-glutamyltranspeptidase/glutathione hydrolase
MEPRVYPTDRRPVFGRNMVATSQPLAVQAGLRALEDGGNAVDAALAAAIMLTVVEPTGNGVGSDAFAIVARAGEVHGYNGSGRSPASWTADRFAGLAEMPRRGWESITVPGAPAAWFDLSRHFGRLPFERLFRDAVTTAREGFPVSPLIARHWALIARNYAGQPGFAQAFLCDGEPPAAGTVFRHAALAGTLEEIAATRAESFYRGRLARAITGAAAQAGAALSLQDLDTHRGDWCGTLSVPFAGGSAHEIPPNTQGLAALIALGLLERSPVAGSRLDSADFHHWQIEATKIALADVARWVADPACMPHAAEEFLSPAYLDSRARCMRVDRAVAHGPGSPRAGGTVCVVAADDEGTIVSFIQSNFEGFGSGVVVPGTGISLQNRAWGFSVEDRHPNRYGPAKRPFHTIIPGLFMSLGSPQLAFGLMGGPMQAQGHVQLLVRTRLFGQDPQAASDAPRWRFVEGLQVAFEPEFDPAVLRDLAGRGHAVSVETVQQRAGFGGAQLIARHGDGVLAGGSDHRKDGHAGTCVRLRCP